MKRILPVCKAGLLLSSQTTKQEPKLEMRIKINEPLRRKSAIATTEKQQKETPILRWKIGFLFWVPYWKRNCAPCQHRKRTPKTGPVFWAPKRGPPFGEIVRAFAAAFLRLTPGLFEYEILCRPTFLIWLMVCCLAVYQPRANTCNCGRRFTYFDLQVGPLNPRTPAVNVAWECKV